MQRIWNETLISAVTEDAEFLGALASQVESHFHLKVHDGASVRDGTLNGCEHSLIVWDLTTLEASELEKFLCANPQVLRTCSLFLICDRSTLASAAQLTEKGAIDFIVKPVQPAELNIRLKLARRPWVRAMRTTFDFLGSLHVEFTTMEQRILLCFLASPDFAASRASINAELWNSSSVNSNSLDVHLFNIRRKIAPTGLEIRFNNKRGSWILTTKNPPHTMTSAAAHGGHHDS
ncbi:MAG: response regulator transcription factor [Bdellovibrionaceae bacterium]|nr:response regulator transcription factor [Pseudobdellovibrionaceae bacterium]